MAAKQFIEKTPKGFYSTRSPLHIYRHEIGHALFHYFKERLTLQNCSLMLRELDTFYKKIRDISDSTSNKISIYAMKNVGEMVAEVIAQVLNGNANIYAREVVKILTRSN